MPADGTKQLPTRVATALRLAAIPPSKLGTARRARLSAAERKLYTTILRRFATSGRPSGVEIGEVAGRLGIDAERALATLAREDLLHLDGDGEIAVAYPFSGLPTPHRVRFPNGHETYAMCAIDALGIAPMFDEPVGITSRDPVNGGEVEVRVTPEATAEWRPGSAVVVAGAIHREGDSCGSCCPVLNFFASPDTAGRWLAAHTEVRGEVISMHDAILAGEAVFGRVLEEV
jgi:Alkylmercury lyase